MAGIAKTIDGCCKTIEHSVVPTDGYQSDCDLSTRGENDAFVAALSRPLRQPTWIGKDTDANDIAQSCALQALNNEVKVKGGVNELCLALMR